MAGSTGRVMVRPQQLPAAIMSSAHSFHLGAGHPARLVEIVLQGDGERAAQVEAPPGAA